MPLRRADSRQFPHWGRGGPNSRAIAAASMLDGPEVVLHDGGGGSARVALSELALQIVEVGPDAPLAERPVVHALDLADGEAGGVQLVTDGTARRPDAEHRTRLHAAQLRLDRAVHVLCAGKVGYLGKGGLDDGLDHATKDLGQGRPDADAASAQLVCLAGMQNPGFPVL